MTNPLTLAELAEIETRAAKAAAGPWRECGHERGGCVCRLVWSQTADATVATTSLPEMERDGLHVPDAGGHNAAFIAASRTDVPRMAAEIRRLLGLLSGVREEA